MWMGKLGSAAPTDSDNMVPGQPERWRASVKDGATPHIASAMAEKTRQQKQSYIHEEVTMWKNGKATRNACLAAGVFLALVFGATQAFAGPECSAGVPPNTCSPNCDVICFDAGYTFGEGQCLEPQHCCQCVEK